jgi:serine phosphatase RsbU (regulator of sigma subunit)
MEVHFSVVKINKYAVSASGDTVEAVERPRGGYSVVMADGQSSGRGAKSVSSLVVRKVITLLAEGVRDGAAARAASDALWTERSGKVSATLNIISIDQHSNSMVITRNNPAPVLVVKDGEIQALDESSIPIGLYRGTRPVISEIELMRGLIVVVYTDGLVHAGERCGKPMDILQSLKNLVEGGMTETGLIADNLLAQALRLDEQRPVDDISVVVASVTPFRGDQVRRMQITLPLLS